jgi:hypothetical protein
MRQTALILRTHIDSSNNKATGHKDGSKQSDDALFVRSNHVSYPRRFKEAFTRIIVGWTFH